MPDAGRSMNPMSSQTEPTAEIAQNYEEAGRTTPRSGRHFNVFQSLLEAFPGCAALVALDGSLEYMNAMGRSLFEGVGSQAAQWDELWPIGNRAEIREALAAGREGRVYRFTAPYSARLGDVTWWDVVVSPIRGDDGSVEAILATSRDITHLRLVETSLLESEQRFRALADTIPQLAWLADATGSVYWFNQRWFDYTGLTFEESKGLGWKTAHHPDHLARAAEKFLACLERGEEWEDVFPLRGADGEYRWFLSRAMPQRNADGVPVAYCGTNTDITEQRNQGLRLRQFARIVDQSHEAIIVREMGGGIVSWNRGCVELYGYSKAEAIGTVAHQLLKSRLPMPVIEFEHLLLKDGAWSGELIQIDRNGSEVWVDSRQELIRAGGQRLVLETNRDITERRRADEIRNLLTAEINHRVKNTLAIVQSLATQAARTETSVSQFAASFSGRLQSLATAHTILTDSDWMGASLADLVRVQLLLQGDFGDRITITGEETFLPPQSALQFSLIVHELATNATQHGALSTESGHVSISWAQAPSDPLRVDFTWRERGGPRVRDPISPGFGLTLIERSGRTPQLNATVNFQMEGIDAFVSVSLSGTDTTTGKLFNPGGKLMRRRVADTPASLIRDRILIVERQPRDAMMLEDMLYDAGYLTVGPVATCAEIRMKLQRRKLDLIVVDVDGLSSEVDEIIGLVDGSRKPYVVVGSARNLTSLRFSDRAPILLAKPLKSQHLIDAITASLECKRHDAVVDEAT